MPSFSPKVVIINHFDDLINQVDIHFEESLKMNKGLGYGEYLINTDIHNDILKRLANFEIFTSQENKMWSICGITCNLDDILKRTRISAVEELRKAQEDSLKCVSGQPIEAKDIEEIKSRLFADKFCFQVLFKQSNAWFFNLFTLIVDFYLPPSAIDFLEYYLLSII